MAVKAVNFTILNNGLGAVNPGGGQVMVVAGVSSTGTANQIVESSNPADFVSAFGYGPAVEAAGFVANTSGNPVVLVKAATAVSGTNSAVTTTGTGTSAVTVSGTPYDTYYAVVSVVTGGTIGVTGIQLTVSLDAGRTVWSTVNLGLAVTYLVPNTGLTLNFGAGTMVAGDTHTFVSTEPKWSTATLASALGALLGSSTAFKNLQVVGDVTAAEAATVDTEMAALFNKKRFARALCNARDAVWGGTSTETSAQWQASIIADFAGFQSDRVSVSAGDYNVVSPYTQTQYRRPASWVAVARDAQTAVGEDISAVALGSVKALAKPTIDDGFIYYDAQANPALDSARFLTLQNIYGEPGWYITNSNMMAAPGTDFTILPYCEVVDEACYVAYQFFAQKLGGSVRVDKTTGYILPADANDLDARATAAEQNALGAGVSSVYVKVNRTNNILSSKTLLATVGIIPLGYIQTINVTMTLVNPALVAV